MTLCTQDEMVVHGNVQETPGVYELPRDGAVIRAWRGIAAGVVVRHDDSCGAEGDRQAEYFTRMNERAVEDSACDFLKADHARLRVERNHIEHFYELARGALAQEVYRVLRSPDHDRLRLRWVDFLEETDPDGPQRFGTSTVWRHYLTLVLCASDMLAFLEGKIC